MMDRYRRRWKQQHNGVKERDVWMELPDGNTMSRARDIPSYSVVLCAVLQKTRTSRNASGWLVEIRRVRRLLAIACARTHADCGLGSLGCVLRPKTTPDEGPEKVMASPKWGGITAVEGQTSFISRLWPTPLNINKPGMHQSRSRCQSGHGRSKMYNASERCHFISCFNAVRHAVQGDSGFSYIL